MNVNQAQTIVKHVTKIAELAATFQALFGSDYQLSEDSPMAAWELYRQIMAEQAQIASLLDSSAIANPFIRYERWWERRDVMNIAIVNEMATVTMRLVEHIAYLTASQALNAQSPNLRTFQETLAGMLHPETRQQALSRIGA